MKEQSPSLDYRVVHKSEAANMLGVDGRRLGHWMFGYSSNGVEHPPLLRNEAMFTRSGEPVTDDFRLYLSWGEFVEAGHLSAWSGDEKTAIPTLRGYVDGWTTAVSSTGTDDVFAHHQLARLGNLAALSDDECASLSDAALRVKSFADKLDFGDNDKPIRYWPAGKDVGGVVDPLRQFGSPIVPGTRVTTYILFGRHEVGDDIELLADDYDLTGQQVQSAITFEKLLSDGYLTAWS